MRRNNGIRSQTAAALKASIWNRSAFVTGYNPIEAGRTSWIRTDAMAGSVISAASPTRQGIRRTEKRRLKCFFIEQQETMNTYLTVFWVLIVWSIRLYF